MPTCLHSVSCGGPHQSDALFRIMILEHTRSVISPSIRYQSVREPIPLSPSDSRSKTGPPYSSLDQARF